MQKTSWSSLNKSASPRSHMKLKLAPRRHMKPKLVLARTKTSAKAPSKIVQSHALMSLEDHKPMREDIKESGKP